MYYIGIDLGGTNIAIGITDETYKLVVKGSVPTGAHRTGDEIVADMAALCKELLAKADLTIDQIAYAGIAAPGSIDPGRGIIEYANNLPFRKFAICDKLKALLGVEKVFIENDANAAAFGEALGGAAKGSKYSVMITLGTGVGGGIVLDNKVYSGFNYAGAELGHMVIRHGGRPCSCGRKGCFEAYCSATALIRLTKEKMEEARDSLMWELSGGSLDGVSGKTAFSAMKQGDKAGAEVVDEYIDYLACGLANVINIFQPNVLCIGGGVCNEKDHLLKPLLAKIAREIYGENPDPAKSTKVCIAELGNDAGIIGAASLGLYQG
jgi:glucokinase